MPSIVSGGTSSGGTTSTPKWTTISSGGLLTENRRDISAPYQRGSSLPSSQCSASLEVPRLHLQRIDMEVRDEDVPHLVRIRPIPCIPSSRAAVGELVTAPCRQFEVDVTIGQT